MTLNHLIIQNIKVISEPKLVEIVDNTFNENVWMQKYG